MTKHVLSKTSSTDNIVPYITLPDIFQPHMMLQRGVPLLIQGTAFGCRFVTICLDNTTKTADVNPENSSFSCIFPAQDASFSSVITFRSDNDPSSSVRFDDIMIGDIWLAGGQSNMEFFLRYDAHWNDTKRLPHNPAIRMYNVPRIAFDGQQRDLPDSGFWFEEGSPAWDTFSAPAHAFARMLQEKLSVPIGIIGCNWGGTPACAWLSEQYLSTDPLNIFLKEYQDEISAYSPEQLKKDSINALAFEDSYRHQLEWRSVMYGLTVSEQEEWMKEHANDPVLPMGPWHHYRPCGLYHTMLEPLSGFPLKGILWYQGESDASHAEIYDKTMQAVISCFRELFHDPSLPFLYVQLAPFGHWLDCGNEGYARIRQQQELVSRTVPCTGMISIMDLGSFEDIHPKFKKEVGERLAALALGMVYQLPTAYQIPECTKACLSGHTLTLYFSSSGTGLYRDTIPVHGSDFLEVTDTNGMIELSELRISGSELHLELSRTPVGTVSVSYAEKDFCEVHIHNSHGLPLKPFHISVSDTSQPS